MKNFLLLIGLLFFTGYSYGQTVTTDTPTNITQTSATLQATGASLDGARDYYVKYYWKITGGSWETSHPESNPHDGTTTSFPSKVDLTGLTASTSYTVRARLYELNDDLDYVAVAWGVDEVFSTTAPTAPTVVTGTVASITTTSGNINGSDATADGGSAITDKGVCFGTSTDPTTETSSGATGLGTYNVAKTGGAPNVKYYARAYATNSSGTAYGSNISFKTAPGAPQSNHVLSEKATPEKITCYWEAGDGGDGGITYRLDVATDDAFTSFVAGFDNKDVGASTSAEVDGVVDGTTYYFRVRSINSYDDGAKGTVTNTSANSNTKSYTAGTNLPVELISFIAQVEEKSVVLNWTTASEINNDYFEIERSLNKEDFEVFAKVEGAGNSNVVVEYSAEDIEITNGVVYYRLKQVDFDGAFEYSTIIAVNRNGDKISLEDYQYDGNRISFNYLNPLNESTVITLVDNTGKIIERRELSSSSTRVIFNRNNLKRGLYIINIVTNNDIVIKKIML